MLILLAAVAFIFSIGPTNTRSTYQPTIEFARDTSFVVFPLAQSPYRGMKGQTKTSSTTSTAGEESSSAAKTQRALWRIWTKTTKAEEAVNFMTDLLNLGVGVPSDMEFIRSEEGRRRYSQMGKKGKQELVRLLTQEKLDDCIKGRKKTRKIKCKLRKKLEGMLSGRAYQTYCSKVKKHCVGVRASVKEKHRKRAAWIVKKYGGEKEKVKLEEDLRRYEECEIFQ